MMKADRKLN